MSDRAYLCRVTSSAVETVPVGNWSLWDQATADFLPGWAGVRLDRLCYDCRRNHNAAAAYGHVEPCGQAPKFLPPTTEVNA